MGAFWKERARTWHLVEILPSPFRWFFSRAEIGFPHGNCLTARGTRKWQLVCVVLFWVFFLFVVFCCWFYFFIIIIIYFFFPIWLQLIDFAFLERWALIENIYITFLLRSVLSWNGFMLQSFLQQGSNKAYWVSEEIKSYCKKKSSGSCQM